MPIYILKPENQYPTPSSALKNYRCLQAYSSLLIDGWGDVYVCCNSWLPDKIGNLIESSAEELLASAKLKDIVNDMNQGNFNYCNDKCPSLSDFLHDRIYNQKDIVSKDVLDDYLKITNFAINLNYDQSCNLQCPSCRNEFIMLDSKDPKTPREFHMVKLHNRAKDLINLLLKTKKSVSLGITGSGDPFASPLYWTYLKELANNPIPDNLYINLQTNGLLMTKENLEKIKPLWKHISHVSVSIDAVKKETYAVVRKNGILDKLKRNLEVFDDMVLDGKFPIMEKWQTNFIVQQDNFRETVEYLEWQLTFKSKPVIWTHLINQWDHISNSEFSKIAVHLPKHSFYKELKQILINPIFKNPQIKLGNLNSLL